MTIIMIVAGFLFSSVSAYMAGLVGSSNNPVSGITIGTILFASLVLTVLMGRDAPLGPVAAIMIGAVVCCAAAVAGDNLQDLKCGYMVGATPWRQQVMLAIGAISCALVMAPVLNLLAKAYGIGVPTAEHPNPLLAPQATLMASVAKGMFGGELPWTLIWIGAAIGAVDHRDRRSAEEARLELPRAGAGRRGRHLSAARSDRADLPRRPARALRRARAGVHDDPADGERMHSKGVLFSAGLITGEALMGILIAIPIVVGKRADVLALPAELPVRRGASASSIFAVIGYCCIASRARRAARP